MIFDCAYVTELVTKWQQTDDPVVLDLILEQSNSLIEAIVSEYDSFYRDDLIQESRIRIQYALPYFDAKRANLHTFLTTVIKNMCLTYLRKQARYGAEYSVDVFDVDETSPAATSYEQAGVLEDLIVRNRRRFPSIPVQVIDEITEFIYEALVYEANKRKVISNLAETLSVEKHVVNIVYTSSLLYLRSKYAWNAKLDTGTDELSIYKDLTEIFGKRAGNHISIILSGMTVRFP